MPANILNEVGHQNHALEGQRALQLAYEMTKLSLNTDETDTTNSVFDSSDKLPRKSANITEQVPVPSSEHVAEIVGRQGCKIKALRAKTNTYIKTPVRGEQPVFVITGRGEDVYTAQREILSAAEHFSQIRASRRNNNGGTAPPGPPSPTSPGQVTIPVPVPYRVVGLVVGPKGATIKRIQQETHTYIVTPSRDKEPIFEVTGLPENVEKARIEIQSHIAARTGLLDANLNGINGSMNGLNTFLNANILPDEQNMNDFHTNGVSVEAPFHDSGEYFANYKQLANNNKSAFTSYTSNVNHNMDNQENIFNFSFANNNNRYNSGGNKFNSPNMKYGLQYESDEGIGSPGEDLSSVPLPPSNIWSDVAPDKQANFSLLDLLAPISGTLSGSTSSLSNQHAVNTPSCSLSPSTMADPRRVPSNPLPVAHGDAFSAFNTLGGASMKHNMIGGSTSTSPTSSSGSSSQKNKTCLSCYDNDIVAALVPCGHNSFCMDCAHTIINKGDMNERRCPICGEMASQAIRIFS